MHNSKTCSVLLCVAVAPRIVQCMKLHACDTSAKMARSAVQMTSVAGGCVGAPLQTGSPSLPQGVQDPPRHTRLCRSQASSAQHTSPLPPHGSSLQRPSMHTRPSTLHASPPFFVEQHRSFFQPQAAAGERPRPSSTRTAAVFICRSTAPLYINRDCRLIYANASVVIMPRSYMVWPDVINVQSLT